MKSKEYVDKILTIVQDMQGRMQEEGFAIPVEIGRLRWDSYLRGRLCILCDGELLLNQDFEKIEQFYQDLPELYLAAKSANQVSDEKVKNVEHTLERLKQLGIEKTEIDLFKKD